MNHFIQDSESNKKSLNFLLSITQFQNLRYHDESRGLKINPYSKTQNLKSSNHLISTESRQSVVRAMIKAQYRSQISDFALLLAIYYFDVVNYEAFLNYSCTFKGPKSYNPERISSKNAFSQREVASFIQPDRRISYENVNLCGYNIYALGLTCLYLAAKFEDFKFPCFIHLKSIFCGEIRAEGRNDEINYLNSSEFSIIQHEIFIFRMLKFNFYQPAAIRFFERLCRAIQIEKTSIQYQLGLFLLHISAMYPSLNFDNSQHQIANAVIFTVLKIVNFDKNQNDLETFWPSYLQELTGHSSFDFFELAKKIINKYVELHQGHDQKVQRLKLVFRKFKDPSHMQVSPMSPYHICKLVEQERKQNRVPGQ
eukprot:403355644